MSSSMLRTGTKTAVDEKKRLELRQKFHQILNELQVGRKKRGALEKQKLPLCSDCGKYHIPSPNKPHATSPKGPKPAPPRKSVSTPTTARATPPSTARTLKELSEAAMVRGKAIAKDTSIPLRESPPINREKIPTSPALTLDSPPRLPQEVYPSIGLDLEDDVDEDDEEVLAERSEAEDEADDLAAEVDEMGFYNFQEFSPDIAQFDGNFEEYLVSLAKTSEDDLDAYRRVREYLACIPPSEFTIRRVGDMDDVTVTDRGLKLLCLLIHTPKSVALWNNAAKYIERLDPAEKEEIAKQNKCANLASVFLSLGPMKSPTASGPDQKVAGGIWGKYEFDSIEDMIDVVEEAWKTAELGYKNSRDFEEEKKFISGMYNTSSGQEPPRRLLLPVDSYKKIQSLSKETLKRKSNNTSPNLSRSPSPPPPATTTTSASPSVKPKKNRQHRKKNGSPKKKKDQHRK